jgi:TolB-like protein/DNA-binding winged helix-turn-helix (wHTH) protein/Tfp pilus assembly protein PilF
VAGTTTYILGDFLLIPGTYSLLRGSMAVSINRKRFDVLLYLVEERHRAVTRQELIQRFWDGHEVYEENVTKCISELRKALEDQQKPYRVIETLPTLGYRYIGAVEDHIKTEPEMTEDLSAAAAVEQAPPEVEAAFAKRSRWRTYGPRMAMVSLLVIAVVSTTLAIVSPDRFRALVSADGTQSIRSLAILPFKPVSEQNRDEFLELGMADALITKLGSLRQVIVLPTAAVRKYASLTQDPIAAGNELGVDSVLDGSIHKLDQRIRVTVRLINIKDGSSLWAETFDEDFTDIFSVQDSISQRVVGALAVRLSAPEKNQIAKRFTENGEAYQLYQKGRYFWNKRTPEGLLKSIDFLEQAVKQDPNYALAYAGLADAYIAATNFNVVTRNEVYPRAKQAALKALSIDSSLAEAHAALAFSSLLFDWNWKVSEAGFRTAIELSPNYGQVRQWFAVSLVSAGRFSEAMAEAQKAQQLEPLSLPINAGMGWVSFLSRKYDRTIEECTKTLEMDPSFGPAYVYRGLAYEQKGMLDKAIADFETAGKLQERPSILAALGHAYAVSGQKTKALSLLSDTKDSATKRYFPAYHRALIHVGLGQNDEAIRLLEQAHQERYPWLIHLNAEPRLDPLRSDPRFKSLVRQVGLGGTGNRGI